MRISRILVGLGAAGALLGALFAQPVAAGSVADFYKGKTITIYIGYSPGGGYDAYARTVGRHIGKHIPGNPGTVAKNRPGAGSLKLANELYNTLPKDGTAIGTIGRGMPMEPLFGTKEAKFDPSKFNWLGSANNEVSVCVSWHKSPIKTLNDFLTKEMIVGGTGPGADTDTFPKVLNNIIGTKLKLVTGYPGGNNINLAIERGEVQGRCGWSWSSVKSTRAQWLRDKNINVLLQMSTAKHPEMPDVPFVMDLAKTEKDRKVLALVFARQAWGRPFVAPPGVPADRAKA
ncbi:MAG: Bug family tripartite tricarboxylate transporter substrate binding protein, partial [Alphaproteobacteria bacterium]